MNAFKIEKGKLKHPVRKAMLSGNLFDILKEANAASKKTRQLGSYITPQITVANLRVIA